MSHDTKSDSKVHWKITTEAGEAFWPKRSLEIQIGVLNLMESLEMNAPVA